MMVRHMASHTSMKLTGPEASAPMRCDERALGPERREVVADAAALLHGQRGFLHVVEDGAEVVLDRPMHEAVEQRHRAARAGAGEDAAAGQEAEVADGVMEARAHFSCARLPPFSRAAAARATRQNVSSSVAS